jgi:hypothetical protein
VGTMNDEVKASCFKFIIPRSSFGFYLVEWRDVKKERQDD